MELDEGEAGVRGRWTCENARMQESFTTFIEGEEVLAWWSAQYEMDGIPKRFLKVDPGHGLHLPCFGLSEGWIKGKILEVYVDSNEDHFRVAFEGPFRCPKNGLAECEYKRWIKRDEIKKTRSASRVQRVEVRVSTFIVRCHDPFFLHPRDEEKWERSVGSSDYDIRTQNPMQSLIRDLCTVENKNVEIFTLFLRDDRDADTFPESLLLRLMTGEHRAAMYFMWPTQHVRASESRGYVEERAFFGLMQRIEAVGIPTRYPAPAPLYRQLCGKEMYTTMCLAKEFNVPITVRLHMSEFIRDEKCVEHAIQAMNDLRMEIYGEGLSDGGGVLKLPFSWSNAGVEFYKNAEELAEHLRIRFARELKSEWRGGQVATSCIIQELIKNRIAELRVHAFADGERSHSFEITYVENEQKRYHSEQMASAIFYKHEEVLERVFNGHQRAHKYAEEEAMRLVRLWIRWYKAEWTCPRSPANARFDFHLCWNPEEPETLPKLWTCEVTECGASLCELNISTRNVALINSMFADKKCNIQGCTCKRLHKLPQARNFWGL